MAESGRPIRAIAVLGGGIVGLSAALAFRHALPGVAVTVIDTPPDPAALADRLTTAWPSVARFHAGIGLAEREIVAAGAALPLLGTRLIDPAGGGFLLHARYGVPIGSVPFHHLWARAWRDGTAAPYAAYCAAAALAEHGQFVHPEDDPRSPLSTYDYGLRIDPPRYHALLAVRADAANIARVTGAFGTITRLSDGNVGAVVLADGRSVTADLFLDCAGPGAPLLRALGVRLERWPTELPDTVVLREETAVPTGSCDTLEAISSGWRWRVPLVDRQIVGHAVTAATAERLPEGERIAFAPGWRDPWCANVLAIGDGAIAATPVPGFHLHLAHLAIARALDLMPDARCEPRETGEYGRRAIRQAERLGDFLALFQNGFPSDGLADTIDQFVRRGRFTARDDDAVPAELWIAALIARGFAPRGVDALAAAVSCEQATALLTDLSRGFASLPAQLPSYAEYLRAWMGAAPARS